MARIGIFSTPLTGHINPLCALAHELAGRGHAVMFFGIGEAAELVRARGHDFTSLGRVGDDGASLAELTRPLSEVAGLEATRIASRLLAACAATAFAHGRPIVTGARLDLALVDHLDYAAASLCAHIGLPFVTMWCSLGPGLPSRVAAWSDEPWRRRYLGEADTPSREDAFHRDMTEAIRPLEEIVETYRSAAGLGRLRDGTLWSTLAQIAQMPRVLQPDVERVAPHLHFTAPWVRHDARPTVDFPWDALDGKPLVYASFGTAQNRYPGLRAAVLEATAMLGVQVVVSLGSAEEPTELPDKLPRNAIVVAYAPQLALLERAALMVTHAGVNSTLECLAGGVPMVAVPIAHDQFDMAARIEWSGAGVAVPATLCEPARLRAAIETVLSQPSYRGAARRLQQAIAATDGLRIAGDLVEHVLAVGRTVRRDDLCRPAPLDREATPMDVGQFARNIRFKNLQPMENLRVNFTIDSLEKLMGARDLLLQFDALQTVLPEQDQDYRKVLAPLTELPRMSTFPIATIIQRAVRGLPTGAAYLNIGVWQGYTLLAGMLGNPGSRVIGVDNFSQFKGAREGFLERFDRLKSDRHSFFELDYREYFAREHHGPIGFYYYDGDHGYEHQLEGLRLAEPYFTEDCYVLVDDTNWPEPRAGTLDFISGSANRYEVLLDQRTAWNGHPTFWNGVMLLQRRG